MLDYLDVQITEELQDIVGLPFGKFTRVILASQVPNFCAFHEATEVRKLNFVGLGNVVLLKTVLLNLSECLLYLLRIKVLNFCRCESPALQTLIVVMVDNISHFRV